MQNRRNYQSKTPILNNESSISEVEPEPNAVGLSVITVVRNDLSGAIKTHESVASQTYSLFEHVVIDGDSTDGTKDFLEDNAEHFSQCVSEPDRGIYDAMNKGIALAKGEWLMFMNAGDTFVDSQSLERAMSLAENNADVVYGDVFLDVDSRRQHLITSHRTLNVHHQGIIYRKSLHEKHGPYLVARGVTISDYLFFCQIADERWKKAEFPLAKCDATGITSQAKAYYQKLTVDFLFGRRGRMATSLALIVYPVYRMVIRPIVRFFILPTADKSNIVD